MIIPIELRFKADKGSKSAFRTEKTIKSHDVNSVEFHISIDGLELTDKHTAKILSIFHSSESQVNTDCEIVEGKIIYKPDTKLITTHEYVTNYVYVYNGNQSLDVREFIYVVDISKIDETSLEVKEVYDQSYADLLADFEQALNDYKDNLPQADSVRADIDEILNQFSEDSQQVIGDLGELVTTVEIAEAGRVEKESERVQAETERIQAEHARKEAETLREESYEQKVDTAIVEADVVEKVDNKVTELTPRMNELTAQLAQKANKGNVAVSDINKNLGKLDQTFMTDEFLQQITGNTPINAVPADGSLTTEKFADKSVTPDKTNFLVKKGLGKNLYNPNDPDIVSGMRLNPDGTMVSHSTFEITGYMPVKAGDVVHASRSGGSTSPMFRSWVLYDSSKVVITGEDSASNAPVSITHDGYLRVTHNPDDTHFQLEIGNQPTDYEPYSETYALDATKIEMPEIETEKITRKTSLTKNLYNPDEVLFNKLLNEDGTLVNNGTYGVTGKIPVEEYQYISVSRGEGSSSSPLIRTFVWFDDDDNVISGNQNGALSPIQAPQGARWLQITHNPIDVNYQVEVSSAPTSYEPFVSGEQLDNTIIKNPTPKYLTPLHGKKLVANGDSIMAGQFPADPTGYETRKYMFIQQVADTFGMDLVNQAIGGSTVAVSTASPNERNPLVERYQDMPDGDLVVISIGTNDWANNWSELGDMSNRSNNTFYGALHNLCLGLIEKYDVNRTQLVFMTPIKRSYGTVLATPESTNDYGKTLGDYAQIIIEVCSYYGIPVIDMYNECSLNPSIESQKIAYVPDGTHPNTEGHDVMARRVIGFIKQLV